MPTVEQEIAKVIARWEGEFQAMPEDRGNWVNGVLVGTMRGVTPDVLAAHRGIPASSVTQDMMKSVTLTEATQIGVSLFYRGTGLDRLPWGPATSALVDHGWGSGPHWGCILAQRACGARQDGLIGPATIEAYTNWIRSVGWKAATQTVADLRAAFYRSLNQPKFTQGWLNRAAWGSPVTPEWWGGWQDAMPPIPEPYSAGGGELQPKPVLSPPATPVEAAKQAASGKTGKALIVAAATGSLSAADAITSLNEATTLATAGRGFLGLYGLPENIVAIVLGVVTVLAIAFVGWRYAYKLLKGEAVST